MLTYRDVYDFDLSPITYMYYEACKNHIVVEWIKSVNYFFELISGARLYTTDVSTRILKKRPLLYLTMDILIIIFSFFQLFIGEDVPIH